jgi:hypothetical protein
MPHDDDIAAGLKRLDQGGSGQHLRVRGHGERRRGKDVAKD